MLTVHEAFIARFSPDTSLVTLLESMRFQREAVAARISRMRRSVLQSLQSVAPLLPAQDALAAVRPAPE